MQPRQKITGAIQKELEEICELYPELVHHADVIYGSSLRLANKILETFMSECNRFVKSKSKSVSRSAMEFKRGEQAAAKELRKIFEAIKFADNK